MKRQKRQKRQTRQTRQTRQRKRQSNPKQKKQPKKMTRQTRHSKQRKRTNQNTSNCGCRYKSKHSNMKILPKLMEVSINHPFHPKSKMPKIPPRNTCNMY